MRTFAENIIFPWRTRLKIEKFAIVNLASNCKADGKLTSASRAEARSGHKITRKAA